MVIASRELKGVSVSVACACMRFGRASDGSDRSDDGTEQSREVHDTVYRFPLKPDASAILTVSLAWGKGCTPSAHRSSSLQGSLLVAALHASDLVY